MTSNRKTALAAGLFFLLTEVTALAGYFLYGPVLNHRDFVLTGVGDTSVLFGAIFEALLVVANIGTAVILYPVIRRQNETLGIGYVAGRLLESVIILIGAFSLLTIVTLHTQLAAGDGAGAIVLVPFAQALIALHDWTFLFGPNLVLGVNTVMLAYVMYRSQLVPRLIATLGLFGGTLIVGSGIAVMFGLYAQMSSIGALAGLPVLAWEVSFGIYLIVKGFKPSPVVAESPQQVGVATAYAAA